MSCIQLECVSCRQDDDGGYGEEVLSLEASQRITAVACSVAEQVERAVTLAVQAISPGGLQILYTLNQIVNPKSQSSHRVGCSIPDHLTRWAAESLYPKA